MWLAVVVAGWMMSPVKGVTWQWLTLNVNPLGLAFKRLSEQFYLY